MQRALPTVFVSHGSPMTPWQEGAPALDAWRALWPSVMRLHKQAIADANGQDLADVEKDESVRQLEERGPDAIVMMSGHWTTGAPVLVSAPQRWRTFHDFGFPHEFMYRAEYNAPGATGLVDRTVELIREELGTPKKVRAEDREEGLDHGMWTPLMMAFPKANIPVLQVSIGGDEDPQFQLRVGRALAKLRQEKPNILVMGSGAMTHNLRDAMSKLRNMSYLFDVQEPPIPFRRSEIDGPVEPWCQRFLKLVEDELKALGTSDSESIAERTQHAVANIIADRALLKRAHPTLEHFVPLMFALGAVEAPEKDHIQARVLHDSIVAGTLSMAIYAFQ